MTTHLRSTHTLALLLITSLVPAVASAQGSGASITNEQIFEAIGAQEGTTVCEIGAGEGALSIAAARVVGPQGHVYTSELGNSRVKALQAKVAASGLSQITVVAGDVTNTNFPAGGCDALFLRNVYHHFSNPAGMNSSIAAALKPGGRVAIVDFTPPAKQAECPADRSKDGMHGVSAESVSREMKDAGFEPVSSAVGAERWFMIVVSKPKG
jgi:tRNA A58 N-methylase Trm61